MVRYVNHGVYKITWLSALKACISYHSVPLSKPREIFSLLYFRFNSTWTSFKFGKGIPTLNKKKVKILYIKKYNRSAFPHSQPEHVSYILRSKGCLMFLTLMFLKKKKQVYRLTWKVLYLYNIFNVIVIWYTQKKLVR